MFITVIYWAALAVASLAVIAALVERVGISAALMAGSLGTAATMCLAEGAYVWSVLLGAVTLAVPAVYLQHARTVRRREVARHYREDLGDYVQHEIGLENIHPDEYRPGLPGRTITIEHGHVVRRYDGHLIQVCERGGGESLEDAALAAASEYRAVYVPAGAIRPEVAR